MMLIQCIVAGEGYQPLVGLQDIRNLKHLTEDAVRDILRSTYRDSELKIVNMGQLTDMSGTNDAFNSSICSLEVMNTILMAILKLRTPAIVCPQVTASLSAKAGEADQATNGAAGDSGVQEQNLKTFHFVIKSPPKASFIKAMHKLTKPFLNEVTWYMVRFSNLFRIECK